MDHGTYELQKLLELLPTTTGILVSVIMLAMFFFLALFPRTKWIFIVGLLYVSTAGRPYDLHFTELSLIPIVSQICTYNRVFGAAILILLLLPTLMSDRGSRRQVLSGYIIAFFILEVIISLLDMVVGQIVRGLAELILFTLLFLTMGIGLSRWIQSISGAYTAVRCLVAMSLLFCLISIIQYFLMPEGALYAGRFAGTAENSNFAGVFIGLGLPATVFLILRRGESVPIRVLLVVALGFEVLLLIWSGSRGAVLVTLISLGFTFPRRLPAFALAVALGGTIAWVGIHLLPDSASMLNRLTSTVDTRSQVWSQMFADFLANPLTGGRERLGSENAYLLVAAHYGLFGLIPFLTFVSLLIRGIVQLRRSRLRFDAPHAALGDLVTGNVVGLLVLGLFDGVMVGVLTVTVIFVYLNCAVLTYLKDVADNAVAIGESSEDEPVDLPHDLVPEFGPTDAGVKFF